MISATRGDITRYSSMVEEAKSLLVAGSEINDSKIHGS